MDTLTFFSRLVDALAWPVAAVGGTLLLRRPLLNAIGLLTRLKYKDLEVSFEKGIARLEEKATTALVSPTGTRPTTIISPELARLAEVSPRAAVVESWIQLSAAAVAALKRAGVDLPKVKTLAPAAVEKALRNSRLLNDEQLGLLRQLRNLRNAAVHGSGFSLNQSAALQYAVTASHLAAVLNGRGTAT